MAVQSTGYALVPESHGVEPLDPRIPVDPINHQRLSHGQTGGPFLAEGLQYLVAGTKTASSATVWGSGAACLLYEELHWPINEEKHVYLAIARCRSVFLSVWEALSLTPPARIGLFRHGPWRLFDGFAQIWAAVPGRRHHHSTSEPSELAVADPFLLPSK